MARSVQQVLDDHVAALLAGDVAKLPADYAHDAVLVTPDGAFVGKEGVRSFFEQFLNGFPNVRFTDAKVVVEGDTVLACWSAECDTATLPQGVDTFIVRDGSIQRQTVWSTIVPKEAYRGDIC